MSNSLRTVVKEPLFQFLLIGVAIYAAYGWFSGNREPENERVVSITSGEIRALSDQFQRVWNRPPTDAELSGVLRDFTRETILYREALAMGLDQDDIVIRRRLSQKLELLAQTIIRPEEPVAGELEAWFEENTENYTQPVLFTMTQVFFDPDKRNTAALDDAKALVEKFNSLDGMPDNLSEYGDSVMLQNYYPSRTELELSKAFGRGFVEQIIEMEEKTWHGPVLSGYGVHVVYMDERIVVPAPSFADIEDQIRNDWMAEKTNELSDEFIESILTRYEVVVEETEVPITVPGGTGAAQ